MINKLFNYFFSNLIRLYRTYRILKVYDSTLERQPELFEKFLNSRMRMKIVIEACRAYYYTQLINNLWQKDYVSISKLEWMLDFMNLIQGKLDETPTSLDNEDES